MSERFERMTELLNFQSSLGFCFFQKLITCNTFFFDRFLTLVNLLAYAFTESFFPT